MSYQTACEICVAGTPPVKRGDVKIVASRTKGEWKIRDLGGTFAYQVTHFFAGAFRFLK